MGARNRVGIGLPYWAARLHRLAGSFLLESIYSWAPEKFKNSASVLRKHYIQYSTCAVTASVLFFFLTNHKHEKHSTVFFYTNSKGYSI